MNRLANRLEKIANEITGGVRRTAGASWTKLQGRLIYNEVKGLIDLWKDFGEYKEHVEKVYSVVKEWFEKAERVKSANGAVTMVLVHDSGRYDSDQYFTEAQYEKFLNEIEGIIYFIDKMKNDNGAEINDHLSKISESLRENDDDDDDGGVGIRDMKSCWWHLEEILSLLNNNNYMKNIGNYAERVVDKGSEMLPFNVRYSCGFDAIGDDFDALEQEIRTLVTSWNPRFNPVY